MSDYKTANLKPETMERLREYAVGDESVDSAVQRLLDTDGSGEPFASVEVDAEDIADVVVSRIQETESLEDRDFDDWFSPDYARTIAEHIRQELESGSDPVELEASEYGKIAREVAEVLR